MDVDGVLEFVRNASNQSEDYKRNLVGRFLYFLSAFIDKAFEKIPGLPTISVPGIVDELLQPTRDQGYSRQFLAVSDVLIFDGGTERFDNATTQDALICLLRTCEFNIGKSKDLDVVIKRVVNAFAGLVDDLLYDDAIAVEIGGLRAALQNLSDVSLVEAREFGLLLWEKAATDEY